MCGCLKGEAPTPNKCEVMTFARARNCASVWRAPNELGFRTSCNALNFESPRSVVNITYAERAIQSHARYCHSPVMGSGSDVELAKFLAEKAEDGARPDKAAVPSEWRWSSSGWDMQPSAKLPSLDVEGGPDTGKDKG